MASSERAGDDPIDLTQVWKKGAALPTAMPVIMPPQTESLLAALYRTEDIAVASDGRRVVIPGFFSDHMLLADLDVVHADGTAAVRLDNASVVQCTELRLPHGASFIDDRTVLVANRGAELLAIDLPERGAGPTTVFRSGRIVVGEQDAVPVRGPSALAVRTGVGLAEVLVCNNGNSSVTRYVLDVDDDLKVIDRELLIGEGLSVPDGIAISSSGQWLAVSNHHTHEVFLFVYEPETAVPARRVGTLKGANYPHGVRFTDDDRVLLLTDAGLPHLYVFTAPDGDWSGVRDPARTLRVMDDVTFNSARYNPQEGGPKGLAVLEAQRAVVMTSTYQHLACLSLDDLLDGLWSGPAPVSTKKSPILAADRTVSDMARRSLRRVEHTLADLDKAHDRIAALEHTLADQELRHTTFIAEREREAAATADEIAGLRAEVGQIAVRLAAAGDARAVVEAELTALRASRSWRITAPIRWVLDLIRR